MEAESASICLATQSDASTQAKHQPLKECAAAIKENKTSHCLYTRRSCPAATQHAHPQLFLNPPSPPFPATGSLRASKSMPCTGPWRRPWKTWSRAGALTYDCLSGPAGLAWRDEGAEGTCAAAFFCGLYACACCFPTVKHNSSATPGPRPLSAPSPSVPCCVRAA